MLAIRFARFGAPEEVLHLEDVPTPVPGAGEVRLRITRRPVNPSDLLTVTGVYPIRPELPGSPGLEGVGHVDELGAGVAMPLGQRVITLAGVPGTWADAIVVPADRVLTVPNEMSDQTAAQFLVNPRTAWALLNNLGVGRGDWVLQTAAGSTLGRLLIQLARLRGVHTLNVVRRRSQVDELLGLGADEVICTEDERIEGRVLALTKGRGIGAAQDAVGGTLGGRVAACLAPGGTLLVLGLLGESELPVTTRDFLFKEATVRGCWLARWFGRTPPEVVGRAMTELTELLAGGRLAPPVEAEYELKEFRAAIAHSERPGRRGKVLMRSE